MVRGRCLSTRFLRQLNRRTFGSLDQVIAGLDALGEVPATVTRSRRVLHLAICGVVPILVLTYIITGAAPPLLWASQNPEAVQLSKGVEALMWVQEVPDPVPEDVRTGLDSAGLAGASLTQVVSALEVHVAVLFRSLNVDPTAWKQPFMRDEWRDGAVRALVAHPFPSEQERAAAAEIVGPFFDRFSWQGQLEESDEDFVQWTARVILAGALSFLMAPVALIGLLVAPFTKGGALLRLMAIGVVTHSGAEATSGRAFFRALVAWGPIVPCAVVTWHIMTADLRGIETDAGLEWWAIVPALVWIAGVVWASYDPQRGPQDRIAGTHLVPR